MRKIFNIAVIFALIVLLGSCAKTEKILIKNDGTWNIDRYKATYEATGFASFTEEELDYGVVTFNESGTGNIEYNDGTSESFDWEVNEDIITLDFNAAGILIDFDILESDKDFQSWSGVYTFNDSGITYVTTIEFELSKID